MQYKLVYGILTIVRQVRELASMLFEPDAFLLRFLLSVITLLPTGVGSYLLYFCHLSRVVTLSAVRGDIL